MLPTISPYALFFDKSGKPLTGGKIYFGVANNNPETNPITVYWDAAGTQPASQPITTTNGFPVRGGTPAQIFVSSDYSVTVKDANGGLISYSPTSTTFAGAAMVGNTRSVSGAVSTDLHTWIDRQQLDTYADFNIPADGTTDNTSALVTRLTALGAVSFRGFIHIPYNTKFTVPTVYAAVPVGITLIDESGINIGHSPGGIQRFRMVYSGDIASDDYSDALVSGHHAVRTYINTADRGTASAAGRFMTEQYAIGVNKDNDLMTTLLRQHKKDPGGNKWMMSYRLQTPYSVAVFNPQNWVASHVYAAGSYCVSDSGKVYVTTAGGTSGGVAPTGTGSSINDGGVLWNYAFPALTIDVTYREEDEQGNIRCFGVPSLTTSFYQYWDYSGVDRMTLTINGSTHDVTFSDLRRGFSFLTVKDTTGVQIAGVESKPWVSVSGATPTLTSSYAYVNNAGATVMTNAILPGIMTDGYLRMFFANNNTTVKHGTNFICKSGADTPGVQGTVMEFTKIPAYSSAWVQI